MCEVGTLGRPHGGSTHAKDDGSGYQGIELGVELGSYVGSVGKYADDNRPLHLQLVNKNTG